MSDQNESPNNILNCNNCGAVAVIPKDAPFEYEDDFCQTCGKSYFEAPEPETHPYDPNNELKRVEVEIIAGDSDMVAYSNDSVKQFIEKRLALAWTALRNADHLHDLAAPNLLTNQDPSDAAVDIIGKCIKEIDTLNAAAANGDIAII